MTVREYLAPGSIAEAVELASSAGPELLVMAGGTVVMPMITDGLVMPERVMTLRRTGIRGVVVQDASLRIGAMTTLSELIAAHPGSCPELGVLQDAARHVAAWAVRNLATVGGNLFTPPRGGDLAVALLALGASVRICGPGASRDVSLEQFWRGSGTCLERGELVTDLVVPRRGFEATFHKFGRRALNTPAVVTVAVAVARDAGVVSEARVALGACGPSPFRSHGAEAALVGSSLDSRAIARAAAAASNEAKPADDAIASAWYRTRMVELFVRRALEELASRGARAAA